MADIEKIFERLKPFIKELKELEKKGEGRIPARDMQALYKKHYGKGVAGPHFGYFVTEFLGYTKKRNAIGAGRYYVKETYVEKPPFYLDKKHDS